MTGRETLSDCPCRGLSRHFWKYRTNFLHDQQIISKIILALAPNKQAAAKTAEHWVEIGPGLGALTTAILPIIGVLDVIELDRDLIPSLVNA